MRLLATALLATFATFFCVAATAGCDDNYSREEPMLLEHPILAPGGETPFAWQRTWWQRMCSNPEAGGAFYGSATPDGKTLVPADYREVRMLGPRYALVQERRPDAKTGKYPWRYYEVGKGVVGDAPPYDAVWPLGSRGNRADRTAVTLHFGFINAERHAKGFYYDVDLYADGSTTPKRFTRVGGPGTDAYSPLFRFGDLIYTQSAALDGRVLSRLYDLRGEPVSPVIARVEVWRTAKVGSLEGNSSLDPADLVSEELLSLIPFEHPDLPYPDIYVPITPGGGPRPLPENVVGVFPLRIGLDRNGNSAAGGNHTYGWGVVLATPKGMRVVAANGSLNSVIAQLGQTQPLAGMKRIYDQQDVSNLASQTGDYFVLKSATDGLWRTVAHNLSALPFPGTSEGRPTARAAYEHAIAERAIWRAQVAAEYERKRIEGARSIYADQDRRWKAVLAGGKVCERRGEVISNLHVDAVNYVLSHCVVTESYNLEYARAKGADPDLLWRAHRTLESLIAQAEAKLQEDMRRAREAEMRNAKFNWEAWGNAMIRNAQGTTDTLIQNNRRTYYENMEKWNRGQQNWGAPSE